MKIYTKTGDSGQTSLIGGTRVDKDHIRLEAYGTVDELNAFLGLLIDHITHNNSMKDSLCSIQNDLFTLNCYLASEDSNENRDLPRLDENKIEALEKAIDQMNRELSPLKQFILPGGNPVVSHCHIARCVCRRAERHSVALNKVTAVDPLALKYLNRLSDYLFVLARKLSAELKANEIAWNPKK